MQPVRAAHRGEEIVKIAVFCATRRGLRVLEKLIDLARGASFVVFSFREEAGEPLFFDDIRMLAASAGAEFFEARRVDGPDLMPYWRTASVDLMLAVNWRYLIPSGVVSHAKYGAYAFHDALLPAYRGFSPTVWAIINGETKTGATLFQLDDGVDSGPVIGQQEVMIGSDEPISSVMEKVTEAYLNLIERHFPTMILGKAEHHPQNESLASYACKRVSADNRIDWNKPSSEIFNFIRALSRPYGGAFSFLESRRIRIWDAIMITEQRYIGRIPGRVVEVRKGEGAVVLAGDGALLLTKVELEGDEMKSGDLVLNRLSLSLS
jgi:methionyl-tRNA formyltransferase